MLYRRIEFLKSLCRKCKLHPCLFNYLVLSSIQYACNYASINCPCFLAIEVSPVGWVQNVFKFGIVLVLVRKAPYEFGVTSIEAMKGFSKVHPSKSIVNHVTTVLIASMGHCAITRPLIGNPFWPGVMHVAPMLNPCWLLLAVASFDMDQSLEPPFNCDMIMLMGFVSASTRSLIDISTVIFVPHVTLTPALG